MTKPVEPLLQRCTRCGSCLLRNALCAAHMIFAVPSVQR
jgi:hypothetical protein